MVGLKITRHVALLATLTIAASASADGILEQMQKEIASLTGRTKSAVVSIEDERAISVTVTNSAGQPGNGNKDALEKKELQDKMTRLNVKKEDLDDQLAGLLTKYTADNPNVTQMKARIKALQDQIEDNKKKLELLGAANAFFAAPNGTQPTTDPFSNVYGFAPKSGTGFSIGDGYIVTTADVLEGMQSPMVVTEGGLRIRAKVVGMNSDLNVGLVKLQAKADVPALKQGDSASVAAGHFALSIGNQGGQTNSVALMLVGGIKTEGTYDGSGRFYPSLIQIAGTVGAGTSGAPLVNVRGEVIGMMVAVPAERAYITRLYSTVPYRWDERLHYRNNGLLLNDPNSGVGTQPNPFNSLGANSVQPNGAAVPPLSYQLSYPGTTLPPQADDGILRSWLLLPQRIDPSESNTALPLLDWVQAPVTSAGFAIPINAIKPVIEELRGGKPVVRCWIGIAPKDETQAIEQEGIVRINRTVKIEGVYPDSPAFHAGLQPGDVLVSINGKSVQSAADVRDTSIRLRLGMTLDVKVKRADKEHAFKLKIEPRPSEIKPPITTPIKDSY